jgi:aryl carrier-like protein
MSLENFNAVIRPKVQASLNLHNVMPKDLDFFILLSSASGIRGGGGQSNYCTGNTFQDALARYRVSKGLKATVLDLGLMLSVGYVAEIVGDVSGLRDEGYASLREDEFHAILDFLCDPRLPITSPLYSQISLGFVLPETFIGKDRDIPWWMHDPLFRHLFQIRTTSDTTSSSNDSVNHKMLLGQAETQEEAELVIVQALTQKLSKAMNIEAGTIDGEQPLHVYGVDSLIAIELRTWFLKELGADVAVFDIMGESTIKVLSNLVAGRSSLARFTAAEE